MSVKTVLDGTETAESLREIVPRLGRDLFPHRVLLRSGGMKFEEHGQERHILLVDDDPDCRLICRALLTYSGFWVTECADGESAVRLARADLPDLILMEVSLPSLDGWDAARLLKRDAGTAHVPIVALTAHALPRDRHRAAQAGFDGYLTKPVAPSAVLDEVRAWLGSGGPVRPTSARPAEDRRAHASR